MFSPMKLELSKFENNVFENRKHAVEFENMQSNSKTCFRNSKAVFSKFGNMPKFDVGSVL